MRRSIKFIIAGSVLMAGLLAYEAKSIEAEPENLWSSEDLEADCGVVLTGATGRIREGFELLARRKIKRLIVSGVYKDARMIDIFPYLPYYPEINPNDVILEKRSETTFGNARFSLNLAEGLRCRDIVLITSQVHMRRAYSVFKTVFPESISIKKLSVANSKFEEGYMGLSAEVGKSLFYHVLSLADRTSSSIF